MLIVKNCNYKYKVIILNLIIKCYNETIFTERIKMYRLYLTTVQNKKDAQAIAKELLRYKAAACVNIVDKISSLYMWKNKVCIDDECLMIIKSREDLFEKVQKIVLTLHKYDLPELIEIPITNGFEDYLGWIDESVG